MVFQTWLVVLQLFVIAPKYVRRPMSVHCCKINMQMMQCHDMQYNLRKFHYFYQCNNEYYYRVELLSKPRCADNGQTVTQAVHLSQYFAVVRHCPCERRISFKTQSD